MLVVSKEIYVSRYHGNNQPSCGETMKTACKFIALGIAHAQWNDTIYIDGTETSRDPYPCLPTTSQLDGIYVNKSLSLRRFGKDEVFIRCSSLRRITLDGRNTSDKVIIYLDGIAFIDSSIAARMSSLKIVISSVLNRHQTHRPLLILRHSLGTILCLSPNLFSATILFLVSVSLGITSD